MSMSKTVILIGPGGLASTLAALQGRVEAPEPAEDHSVAAMLEGLRAARAERTAADYDMDCVNALFEEIFGHAIDEPVGYLEELPFIETDDLCYEYDGPEFPGLHALFGMTDEEYAEAEAEEAEQLAFAKGYAALMRMLDVFSVVSGYPVTDEQRIAMTLLLSNDDTAEAFATAAEDLLASGLFE